MVYIFDSSSLIVLFKNFYLRRFPTLWSLYDSLIDEKRILSVREVRNEVKERGDRLSEWSKRNGEFYQIPTNNEMLFIQKIFLIRHFQAIVRNKERLLGKPVADPFVIAKANEIAAGCVVTEETYKKNAAKIPNICQHFNIRCINLREFMEIENWVF